jgi:hypothetical protein
MGRNQETDAMSMDWSNRNQETGELLNRLAGANQQTGAGVHETGAGSLTQ